MYVRHGNYSFNFQDQYEGARKSRWIVPLNTQYVVHIQAGIKEIS
jgi:hypothetical protein